MKKNVLKIISVFLVMFLFTLSLITPNVGATAKYNYIANGEKNILGFKISNIVQIQNCDTIYITMRSDKNIKEFSNYQETIYNGKHYLPGNYPIANEVKNATFVFSNIKDGTELKPIIIYVDTIENTSCPLVISHLKGNELIEEVSLTLSATFYANKPSEIVGNKENISGSLIQEDIVVNRPEKNDSISSVPEKIPSKPNNQNNVNESSSPVSKPSSNVSSSVSNISTPEQITTEIELPIIHQITDQTNSITSKPNSDEEKPILQSTIIASQPETEKPIEKPNDEPKETNSFLDFINNLDKKIFYVAIVLVSLILIAIIVLIILLFTKDKNTDDDFNENIPVEDALVEETPIENTFVEVLDDKTSNETEYVVQEETGNLNEKTIVDEVELSTETKEMEDMTSIEEMIDASVDSELESEMETGFGTIISDTEPETNETTEQCEEIINEDNKESIVQNPPVTQFDAFEVILTATIPTEELEKLKANFGTGNDEVDKYDNIVQ